MATSPGMPHVALAHRIAEAVWRQHFRIPEPAYWAGLLVSAVGFSVEATLEALAWSGVFLLSVIGILRWHWHRRRSRALVVARFSAVAGQEGMAVGVQDLVMTSLQDKLPPDLVRLVHPVPAVVGSADRRYAATLRSRLRSLYVIRRSRAHTPSAAKKRRTTSTASSRSTASSASGSTCRACST